MINVNMPRSNYIPLPFFGIKIIWKDTQKLLKNFYIQYNKTEELLYYIFWRKESTLILIIFDQNQSIFI